MELGEPPQFIPSILKNELDKIGNYSQNKTFIELDEIKKMKIAGKLASDVLMMIKDHVRPGISTGELDRICHNYIVDIQKAIPAPLNYKGFPKSICTSINHQICHGIPSDSKKLKNGEFKKKINNPADVESINT